MRLTAGHLDGNGVHWAETVGQLAGSEERKIPDFWRDHM